MEFDFSTSLIFLASVLFVFMIRKLIQKRSANLPPGPWRLPVIGNLHQLAGSDLAHRRLTDLAKRYGPLMHLQIGELSTVVVSSAEIAKEMMKTHDIFFASRPYNFGINILCYNSTNIGFSQYGDYWRQLKKICTLELLSKKRVESFRSVREEEVSNLVSWIASKAGSRINLTEKIHSLTHGIMLRTAFSMKPEDLEVFTSLVQENLDLVAGFSIVDMFPSVERPLLWITGLKSRYEKLHGEMDRILENIIDQHKCRGKSVSEIGKREENEDLIDVLLKIQEDAAAEVHLTTDNIKAVLMDFFVGGSDTSATTLDWAIAELMKNPGLMKKAQAEVREVFDRIGKVDETGINEMKFLKLVIKETLRLHTPGPLTPRECREGCEISGFEIPTKTRVLVNAWAIARDPESWSEPESFIPERFLESPIDYKGTNFEYIPFGAGRRICPGISFGMASVELPLAMLLYHFDWKLPEEMKVQDLNMTESFSFTVRRKENLYTIPIPYLPPSAV